jgi:DNA-directed RNA polymerase subunit D
MLEKGERNIKFVVDDVTPAFANSLRRIIMGEIPVLAIEDVDFYNNDSILYDEVIAHRLGLVPLIFDQKAFKFKDDCSCKGKGCSNCQVVLVINKNGPSVVYTKDMKSSDVSVKPLFEEIPIVELNEGQVLKAEGTAILGLGKDHAKFQAAVAGYRYYPAATLNGNVKNPEACVKVCPKNALMISGGKAKVTVDCDLCQECANACDPKGALEVKGKPDKVIFNVESVSGLNAGQIIIQALDILKKMAKDFEKEIGKLK